MKIQQTLKRSLTWASLFLFLGTCHGEASPSWLPPGQTMKCPVTRDTWLSSVGKERNGSNGGAGRLKLKGQQEYILLDIDPSLLKGKIITGALLHARSASPEKAPLARVGVSTLASRWTEGNVSNYRTRKGVSCYAQAQYGNRDWAYPGSTLMDVVFGRGHTFWKFADCTSPDPKGWQTCAVDTDVISARVAGLSHGFCLYDEVGNVWSLRKGKFKLTHFPNRFCHSRESGKSGPWLEVWTQGADTVPPGPIRSIEADTKGFPAGEALIRWQTPEDDGGGKVLGFHVTYMQGDTEKSVPRYLIPMAGRPGEDIRMHIRDIPFQAGEMLALAIRSVDSVGNVSDPFRKAVRLSVGSRVTEISDIDIRAFPPSQVLPKVGNLSVGIVDLLDKIVPKNGKMIPPRKAGYKGGNHIFSAKEKQIRLHSARNETVAFQICLEGNAKDLSIGCVFEGHPNINARFHESAYVNVLDPRGKVRAILPDPLIPLESEKENPKARYSVSNFKIPNHSLICEIYVPHKERPGLRNGKLSVIADGERLELDVSLTVWNFTLPNKLSFVPEMNAYGTVSPYKGHEYYRLAHEHRTCINRLPYGWNGLPGFAPDWNGHGLDWSEWDQKVGPILDGSAFQDLPRSGEPLDVFYLPFSENWPVRIFDHYAPSYWAEQAFTAAYSDELKNAFGAFARHCHEKKWHDTQFQFYLNNKVKYRGGFAQSSAPWFFDEPVNTQDFWALRWYGHLWHLAVEPVRMDAQMAYRSDISYTQFSRNILWGITDVEYLGGINAQKLRMKHDEQILHRKVPFAEYGTANRIGKSNTQPVLWCLSAWLNGADGILPWQTIGGKDCWQIAQETALFYPHPKGPKPSVRLKAFTRGQQDVEYLALFADIYEKSRAALKEWAETMIRLKREIRKISGDDAGTSVFEETDAAALWKLRYCVGKMLSEKGPVYKRKIVSDEMSQWNVKDIPDIGYVPVAPNVKAFQPVCDRFGP